MAQDRTYTATNPFDFRVTDEPFIRSPGLPPVNLPTPPHGPVGSQVVLSSREIEIQRVCNKLAEMLIKKNRDYGSGNINRHGQKGILVRIDDKTARIENLLNNPSKVNCESIDDNWLDIAGYAILGYIIAE